MIKVNFTETFQNCSLGGLTILDMHTGHALAACMSCAGLQPGAGGAQVLSLQMVLSTGQLKVFSTRLKEGGGGTMPSSILHFTAQVRTAATQGPYSFLVVTLSS